MRVLLTILFTLFFISWHTGVFAQSKPTTDLPHFISFPKTALFRVFAVQKYTVFRIASQGNILRYRSNKPLALGIGFSYNSLAINIAYAPGFLKDADKGKTKGLDLQAHIYARRWISDFYTQWHKGFYMASGASTPVYNQEYLRPDIQTLHIGFDLYRVFNSTKFSYRSAFLQTERQERSAGTPLAGAGIHYGSIWGDSSLIPFSMKDHYLPQDPSKVSFISLSPGAGYAYTLVVKRKYFMTASATVNLNINYTNVHRQDDNHTNISASPVWNLRTSAGYNGDGWVVSANWIAANLPLPGNSKANRYMINTGMYRFTVARRFKASKKLQKRLQVVDKLFKEGISQAKSLPLVPGN